MIFLIEYEELAGQIRSIQSYESGGKQALLKERLRLEIENLGSDNRIDIITLEADSLDDLMESHPRYWHTLDELFNRFTDIAARKLQLDSCDRR